VEFVAFLLALSVHEAAHAWVASLRGDQTARLLGRVTLNPIKHIDVLGSVVFPLLMLFSSANLFFGWAKPTPVDPRQLKNPKWDDILVTLAGPASNFLLALVAVLAVRLLLRFVPGVSDALSHFGEPQPSDSLWVPVANFAFFSLMINVVLAVFNLIPIPPLDGSHVLRHFLPESLARPFQMLYHNGALSLLLLVAVIWVGVPDWLFRPVMGAFERLLP
jgi:Zn-dependent protease